MLLSVIIVSYNSKHVLQDCFNFLFRQLEENFPKKEYEVIVVDNGSTDETPEWLREQKEIQLLELPKNTGFAVGNNEGLKKAHGKYVLLLNSDAYLKDKTDFNELIQFLEQEKKRGALTVKLMLPGHLMDKACHRGFPTPFNSMSYFVGLETLTKHTPFAHFFGGYHQTWKKLDTIHEIDCPSAAFFLVKKKVMDEVGGFDSDYFFYAEDIDLCYRIKESGYSIWFYPAFQALHLKGQSGIKSEAKETRKTSKYYFYSSMLMFYEKHYAKKHGVAVNWLVEFAIKLLMIVNG